MGSCPWFLYIRFFSFFFFSISFDKEWLWAFIHGEEGYMFFCPSTKSLWKFSSIHQHEGYGVAFKSLNKRLCLVTSSGTLIIKNIFDIPTPQLFSIPNVLELVTSSLMHNEGLWTLLILRWLTFICPTHCHPLIHVSKKHPSMKTTFHGVQEMFNMPCGWSLMNGLRWGYII